MNKLLIIDNGSHTVKIGFAGEEIPRFCFPNCIGKVRRKDKIYTSDQIYGLNEYFTYCPFSDGLLVDISLQFDIWTHIFNKINLDPTEFSVLVTEPLMNPTPLQHTLYEMIFEQFCFKKAVVSNPPALAQFAFNPSQISLNGQSLTNPCYLILDCGYQSCFSVPIYQGSPISEACRRLDVGGYHLDLSLKNSLSFRQLDLSRNSLLISKIKEMSCYVSDRFEFDLNSCNSNNSNPEVMEHIIKLPEQRMSTNKSTLFYTQEYIAPENIELRRNNEVLNNQMESEIVNEKHASREYIKLYTERISVPELLFNPSYYGYKFAGIAEMITESIFSSPKHMQELLANNILLIGGSTKFKNFERRLNKELTTLLPSKWRIQTRKFERPEYTTWIGGSIWGDSNFETYATSINQYREC